MASKRSEKGIWFDQNLDGESQAHELKSLKNAGVTKIGIRYEAVPEQLQDTDDLPFGNKTLYSARFFCPENLCGSDGCRSYDVFFRTIESLVQN